MLPPMTAPSQNAMDFQAAVVAVLEWALRQTEIVAGRKEFCGRAPCADILASRPEADPKVQVN